MGHVGGGVQPLQCAGEHVRHVRRGLLEPPLPLCLRERWALTALWEQCCLYVCVCVVVHGVGGCHDWYVGGILFGVLTGRKKKKSNYLLFGVCAGGILYIAISFISSSSEVF